MTTMICLLVTAALLHLGSKAGLVILQSKEKGGYDNNTPRAQQARLANTAKGVRALSAHQNQIESFPLFAAGVIVSCTLVTPNDMLIGIAMAHIVARILYLVLYALDIATIRTLVWAVGYASSLALIASPLWV